MCCELLAIPDVVWVSRVGKNVNHYIVMPLKLTQVTKYHILELSMKIFHAASEPEDRFQIKHVFSLFTALTGGRGQVISRLISDMLNQFNDSNMSIRWCCLSNLVMKR